MYFAIKVVCNFIYKYIEVLSYVREALSYGREVLLYVGEVLLFVSSNLTI